MAFVYTDKEGTRRCKGCNALSTRRNPIIKKGEALCHNCLRLNQQKGKNKCKK